MISRQSKLFVVLAGFFVANALIAELIGGKIFSVESTLGIDRMNFSLLGQDRLGFDLTAGILLWPVVFIITDLINEYFGRRGVKFLTYLTLGLIAFAFLTTLGASKLVPAEFWPGAYPDQGVPDMQKAFAAVFGQGRRIMFASMIAFLLGQLIDAWSFHRIKKVTGEKRVWLRATGSTLISQFIDSFLVLGIAFWGIMSIPQIIAIGLIGYLYKLIMALIITPIIYLGHKMIDRYLGKEEAQQLKLEAMRA